VVERVVRNETPPCVPKSIFPNDLSACAWARVLKSYNLALCGGVQGKEAWPDCGGKVSSCKHLRAPNGFLTSAGSGLAVRA